MVKTNAEVFIVSQRIFSLVGYMTEDKRVLSSDLNVQQVTSFTHGNNKSISKFKNP